MVTWNGFPIDHFLFVVLWNEASISNGFQDIQWRIWRNGWRDLNVTSTQDQSALAVITCVLHKRDSWLFLEQGQNMATEALPSNDLVSGTVYLLSSSRRVPRYLMANVTQWLNYPDTTSKQTSRSFFLVPIDFSCMTSPRLSIGPSNLCLAKTHRLSAIHWRRRRRQMQHCCGISTTVSTVG